MSLQRRSLAILATLFASSLVVLPAGIAQASGFSDGYDAVFEQAMIDRGHDSGALDGKLPLNTIRNITSLDLSGVQFTNFGGFRYFNDFSSLRSLNISGNTQIETINNWNLPEGLQSLNISGMTSLTYISMMSNGGFGNGSRPLALTTLTTGNNTLLSEISVRDANLSSIDVTGLNALVSLDLTGNRFTQVSLSNLPELTQVMLQRNRLSSLTFTNIPKLESVLLNGNDLSSINLSGFPNLSLLQIANNKLTSLDLSANSNLVELHANHNRLTSLVLPATAPLQSLYVSQSIDIIECKPLWEFAGS
jgi:hypothetical protein